MSPSPLQSNKDAMAKGAGASLFGSDQARIELSRTGVFPGQLRLPFFVPRLTVIKADVNVDFSPSKQHLVDAYVKNFGETVPPSLGCLRQVKHEL
ncbi:hypothetical protein TNIN_107981 [Trichonephila inaurata madagascariensis]|uniref:Uncharacterized protein n=1 Tax=Trichonephila inaurata madagascariensis TaxID=2747483 RepID=A0A8X6XU08_9ARAC|nr:hypothetical protein TNIN_107981 [Trichonephila inaurata madagascariensis]